MYEERDITFTSDFCDNHSHPASPASLFLTSPCPLPSRPRVPYLMSSSPLSRVPKSQVPTHAFRCPRPLVPVPLLYTALMILQCDASENMTEKLTFHPFKLSLDNSVFYLKDGKLSWRERERERMYGKICHLFNYVLKGT